MQAEGAALTGRKPTARARLTNGTHLPRGIDGRSAVARRFKDVVDSLTAELGGERALSVVELGTVRHIAALTVRAEQLQLSILRGQNINHDELIRLSSEERRALAALKRERRRKREQPAASDLRSYLSQPEPQAPSPARSVVAGGAEVAPASGNAPAGPGESAEHLRAGEEQAEAWPARGDA
jgi:hypothetical protein